MVVPGIALAYEVAIRRSPLRQVARTAALWAVGPLAYGIAYLVRPPVDTAYGIAYLVWPPVDTAYAAEYYGGGLAAAAKIPSTLAAFCGLTTLDVTSLRFGPAEWVSLMLLAALVGITIATREPSLLVGLALFLLPFLPVIPVGFMIARYAYTPFAGFLLMAVGLARVAAGRAATPLSRWAVKGLGAAAAIALVVSGLPLTAAEISDAERRDEGHRVLLEEAERLWNDIPHDRQLVCVRLESRSFNAELLDRVEGFPKAYFERATYPYGLVRWAELLSWTGWPRGGPLWEEVPSGAAAAGPFAVIGHLDGGFVLLESDAPTAAAAAAVWSERGCPVRVIRPVPTG